MSREIPLPALGQYSVPRLQAPRVPVPQTNNLLELAKGLNVVSDIVVTYDQIQQTQDRQRQALEKARALKGKEREAYEQALITEGATQFDLDPGGVSRQMEAYEREVRKLAEEGKMPEQANALFMLGAKQAKGKVLANNVYREMLFNPQTISETIDPVQTVQEKRQELFNRPEFQSELVRQAALENLQKVEQEFIKDVNARFDAIDIEDAKTNWLLNGKPLIQQSINGVLDINDPSIKNWVNDKVGLFKGSRKYAWDNLISETLNEGLSKDPSEEGSISPQQAETFLDELRKLDLGGGVKFADAEVGNSITSYYDKINDRRSKWEARKNEQYNTQYRIELAQAETELLELMGDGEVVSPTDEARIKKELRAKTPLHLKTKVNKDINDVLDELVKPSTESTQLSVANLELLIDEGDDLDSTLEAVMRAGAERAITPRERNTLIQRIESSRNFTKLVYDDPIMKTLRNGYRETITGFEQVKPGGVPSGIRLGFFTRLGVSAKVQETADVGEGGYVATEENYGVYYQIQRSMGKDAADMFVNKRYVAFEKDLREAFQDKFDEIEQDEQTSPQEAKAKVLEQMEAIGEQVFKRWTAASIDMAVDKYKVNRNRLEGI
jgi:hypothetical protein